MNAAVRGGPEALQELLAELDGLAPSVETRRSRVLCWLALAGASAGEERAAALTEMRTLLAEERDPALVGASCELASALVVAGKLAEADDVAGFALELLAELEPVGALLLWRVRAEAARLGGDWERAGAHVASWEASLASALEELARAQPDPASREWLEPLRRWYRALIGVARALTLLELGLLDRSRELAVAAEAEAEAAGDASALLTVWQLRCDLDLLRQDFAGVVALTARPLDDPRVVALAPALLPYAAVAHVELVREAGRAGRDASADESRARARIEQALAAPLSAAEHLKMRLARCELELLIGAPEAARAELARAAERTERQPAAGGAALREELLLPVYRWEIARRAGGPDERDAARPGVARAFDTLLAQWASTPLRAGGIGFLHLSWRTQVVSAAIEAELATEGEDAARRALQVLLRAEALGTLARRERVAVPELARIQAELLGPGRGALVLLPAHYRSHLFLIDAREVQHYDLPASRDELRALARATTGALLDPSGPAPVAGVRALSAALLPEAALARLATWGEVYALGFDLLGDLPFGVLVDRAEKPLGARMACATLPSLAYGLSLVRRAPPPEAKRDLALIVAQDPGAGSVPPGAGLSTPVALAPFGFGAEEQRRLTAPFARVELLEGPRATRAAVLAESWRDARVLFFLAHGVRLPKREYASALALSGSVLTAEDAAALEVGPLVVLAACGTGRGPARIGDDQLVSLGGAFLAAGARCVVLARFPVEYATTLALMEPFLRGLAAGRSPARAWSEARAGAATDARAAFHAGAFEILGLGHEPVLPPSALEGARR